MTRIRRTTYDELPQNVRTLHPADLVDLEGVDQSAPNWQVWAFEYAEVEAVSTHDAPAGGWCDGLLWTPEGEPSGVAVIYVENAATPAVVADATIAQEVAS
jgi:hypothetical protein